MFLECLCAVIPSSEAEELAPTSLTRHRSLAKADVSRPLNKAMGALATISRVKDWRTIMLQEGKGVIELVTRGLSNKDAEMFSSTVLLTWHLLWYMKIRLSHCHRLNLELSQHRLDGVYNGLYH